MCSACYYLIAGVLMMEPTPYDKQALRLFPSILSDPDSSSATRASEAAAAAAATSSASSTVSSLSNEMLVIILVALHTAASYLHL